MLYCVQGGTAISVGLTLVMHCGLNPMSTDGASVDVPLPTNADPDAGWKSGFVPLAPANSEVDIDTTLFDGMLSVPPPLSIQPAAGSCVDPLGIPTLLTIVRPCVWLPDVK